MNRQARFEIASGRDLAVPVGTNTVLGAEQRNELHASGRRQNLNGSPTGTVATGIIGEETDAQTRKLCETTGSKHVDAELHLGLLVLISI